MTLEDFIDKVSKIPVIEGVVEIANNYLPNQEIISATNPLITDGANLLKRHADIHDSYTIPQSEIKSFLAASSLSHLLDGWTYLQNAFQALLNGDSGTAIHLSYYAELRSAMSILSTEGLGVFSDKNIGVFSSTDNCEFPKNYDKGIPPNVSYKKPSTATHVFVWEAMEKWIDSPIKPDADILKIFTVRDKTFYSLIEYFHPSTGASTLRSVQAIKSWLKEWCLDIRTFRQDRELRNDVSYRPQKINGFSTYLDFKTIISNLDNYWRVISPSVTDKYSLLDTYLLRKLFYSLYQNLNSPPPLRDLIENAFNQHGINDKNLFDFLSFEPPYQDDHIIFNQASQTNTNALSILARATLLLRISVGLVSQLFHDGGINKAQLSFVWNSYAVDNGFWNNGAIPNDFNNLWNDIEPYLTDLRTDINTAGTNISSYSIRNRMPQEILYLVQINRACMWGLNF